ncbi:MAG TPA: hypothetical protein VMU24_13800 [Candidatus Acidoferrales bacterium]|nr:hypothetical protein [Candidatus Acidoferrales bacterium]
MPRRFEIGSQLVELRTDAIADQYCFACSLRRTALGPTFAVNLNRHFAIDSAFAITPTSASGPYGGGRTLEALAGIRGRVSGPRYGMFAYARPGIVRWSQALQSINVQSTGTGWVTTANYGARTDLALDLGVGSEYYLAQRTAVRLRIGDMVVRNTGFVNEPGWHHNLQVSSELVFAAGHPLKRDEYATTEDPYQHKFFDRRNLGLLAFAAAGMMADAVTTQHMLARGYQEKDPLARPFVNHGWGGQMAVGGILLSADLLAEFGLHKLKAHRIERLLPVVQAGLGAWNAYRNHDINHY